MENLKKSLNSIMQVKKSKFFCLTHKKTRLIICPSKDCTGCHFDSICNNNSFCGKCADILKDKNIETRQSTTDIELKPILKELREKTKLLNGIEEGLKNNPSNSVQAVEARSRVDKIKSRIKDLKEQKKSVMERMR